jgi:hypothetical protein
MLRTSDMYACYLFLMPGLLVVSICRPWLTSEELSNTLLKSLQQRQAQATSFNNNNIRAEEIPHFGSFKQNPVAGVGG